ncbi:MAG: tRNA uridine-5-carboxymethylaminomethyl(34) synthesis GTPase MnmE, partial [Oscillospiraceae bacterium]
QFSAYFTQVCSVSSKNTAAKPEIEKADLKLLKLEHVDANAAMLANERQLAAVVSAINSLLQAEEALEKGFTFDAAGVCLEDALHALSELTGESATDAIVEDVFSRFCVGK